MEAIMGHFCLAILNLWYFILAIAGGKENTNAITKATLG